MISKALFFALWEEAVFGFIPSLFHPTILFEIVSRFIWFVGHNRFFDPILFFSMFFYILTWSFGLWPVAIALHIIINLISTRRK